MEHKENLKDLFVKMPEQSKKLYLAILDEYIKSVIEHIVSEGSKGPKVKTEFLEESITKLSGVREFRDLILKS